MNYYIVIYIKYYYEKVIYKELYRKRNARILRY